jgi:hypothetical protein
MPGSAPVGPYGAQIPGSTGAFREDLDEEEDFFKSECFIVNVELVFDVNKDLIFHINTFGMLCLFAFLLQGRNFRESCIHQIFR